MSILQKYKILSISLLITPLLASAASLTGGDNEIGNPIQSNSFEELLNRFFQAINPVVALGAMFFIFLSGYKFLTAQGEPKKIQEAQQMFLWTVIGVAIVVGAQLIIKIVKDIIS